MNVAAGLRQAPRSTPLRNSPSAVTHTGRRSRRARSRQAAGCTSVLGRRRTASPIAGSSASASRGPSGRPRRRRRAARPRCRARAAHRRGHPARRGSPPPPAPPRSRLAARRGTLARKSTSSHSGAPARRSRASRLAVCGTGGDVVLAGSQPLDRGVELLDIARVASRSRCVSTCCSLESPRRRRGRRRDNAISSGLGPLSVSTHSSRAASAPAGPATTSSLAASRYARTPRVTGASVPAAGRARRRARRVASACSLASRSCSPARGERVTPLASRLQQCPAGGRSPAADARRAARRGGAARRTSAGSGRSRCPPTRAAMRCAMACRVRVARWRRARTPPAPARPRLAPSRSRARRCAARRRSTRLRACSCASRRRALGGAAVLGGALAARARCAPRALAQRLRSRARRRSCSARSAGERRPRLGQLGMRLACSLLRLGQLAADAVERGLGADAAGWRGAGSAIRA